MSRSAPTRIVTVVAALAATAAAASGCATVSGGDPNLANGKRLFAAKCGSCHILGRAGSKGVTGPNLDAAYSQALKDGFPRSTYEGVTHRQILYPDTNGAMPAKLVTGQDARDVAAYVAWAADRPGKDTGVLDAVVPGLNQVVAKADGGNLEIDSDPNGQLKYLASSATSGPGALTISSKNDSAVPHNIALKGGGFDIKGSVGQAGHVSTIKVTVKKGEYTFYCSVPGHEQAGMKGILTVK